ncbi:flagellar biosynthetic protein FliO [Aurantimonas sp. HBX-1]|uniref:flagellar biosynthetic protein FliO n=1 Tax=Aurantimonas sp. HBX-1 TaxID=2906072 RepID=UPI001F2B1061|nr:flagellar biosynthetic protein FliO [Aurantimonas sp. HBX-1]UIJ73512.1 flagellar biosynthetic protein FliO [Aurantimonas sp. HBX-1]
MPQWIVDIVGESLAPIVWVAIVALVVCLLAIVVILLARKAFGGLGGGGFKTRAPRLAVMDVARIDEKRRLVLVRRDEVEHLVLVGGQTDILLEGNILRVPAAARARAESQLDRHPEPEDAAVTRRWDAPSHGEERQAPAPVAPTPAPARQELRHPVQNGAAAAPEPRAAAAPSPVATPAPVPAVASARPVTPKRDPAPLPEARRPEPEAVRLPPRPPVPPAPPRSMATPTLPVPAPREESNPPQPSSPPRSAGRIEPSLTVPEPHPAPDMSPQRAELRDRLNRAAQELPRAPAVAAPAATPDRPAEAAPERRPLSVRSFATAIQNRGAAPEPQAPAAPPKPPVVAAPVAAPAPPAPPAPPQQPPAAAPAPEPSLEDFLSAELDSELSREEAPQASPDRVEEPERQQAPDPAVRSGAAESARPAPAVQETTSPRAPEPSLDTPPSAGGDKAPDPARKLTLEEEMERLLGDFSFGESERRDRG